MVQLRFNLHEFPGVDPDGFPMMQPAPVTVAVAKVPSVPGQYDLLRSLDVLLLGLVGIVKLITQVGSQAIVEPTGDAHPVDAEAVHICVPPLPHKTLHAVYAEQAPATDPLHD